MEFTLEEQLDLKNQEIELLRKALRDVVQEKEQEKVEKEHWKGNAIISKHIGKIKDKYTKALEEELLCYKGIISN